MSYQYSSLSLVCQNTLKNILFKPHLISSTNTRSCETLIGFELSLATNHLISSDVTAEPLGIALSRDHDHFALFWNSYKSIQPASQKGICIYWWYF